MTQTTKTLDAACLMLAIIQAVMLASLWFGVAPHPPRATPLFAMAPFLAVSIGTALSARVLITERSGRILAAIAATLALFSFGPQKYVDPAFGEIWVAVLTAQICVITIALSLIRTKGATA